MPTRYAASVVEHWTAFATFASALLAILGVIARWVHKAWCAIDDVLTEIKDNTRRTNKLQMKLDYMIENGTKPMQEIMDKAREAEK